MSVTAQLRLWVELIKHLCLTNAVCSLKTSSLYWVSEGKAALNLGKVLFLSHEKAFKIQSKLSQIDTVVYSFGKERLNESGNSVLPALQ